MREFFKSLIRFSWTMPLFGARQAANLLTPSKEDRPQDDPAQAMDSVSKAAAEQMGPLERGVLETVDKMQSGMVDAVFDTFSAAGQAVGGAATGRPAPSSQPRPDSGRLNPSTFVALGSGLAAGMGNFTLGSSFQRNSFPAQMARQMGVRLAQPRIQPPGIGNPVGFNTLPVIVPGYQQSTVLEELDPEREISNLSIPGLRLSEALRLRPAPPLVQRSNIKLTTVNLVLGASTFLEGKNGPWKTQLEYALERNPSFAVVELGFSEALQAAVCSDLRHLPSAASFKADFKKLVASLKKTGAEVLALNIPDPFDTAYFSTLEAAARTVKVEAGALESAYGLKGDDLLTVHALYQIGTQFLSRNLHKLPRGSVVSAPRADEIAKRIDALNRVLTDAVEDEKALLFDLKGFYRRLAAGGVQAGCRTLTADYLGGFYSLNGYFPGHTGQALIANQLLDLINRTYAAHFPLIDIEAVLKRDPVADFRPAPGPSWNAVPPAPPADSSGEAAAVDSSPTEQHSDSKHSAPQPWQPLVAPGEGTPDPLKLPPGLEQLLPLSTKASYFGDSILAIDCQDRKSAQWGSCEELLFSGLALTDSQLSGQVRIKFSPPVNNLSHFEVSVGSGLSGQNGILSAPRLYRLPSLQNQVQDFPGLVSSGDLDLRNGTVLNAKFNFSFANTALLALIQVNPHFPQVPIQFPGQYGSSWAEFEQRPDGKLDFTFFGSTFLPLGYDLKGDPVRFPLPFSGPTLQFASIPSRGTALHPHIQLTTKDESHQDSCAGPSPKIPFNSMRELSMFTHSTSFGDKFNLDIPAWGGTSTGRSHVMGRVQIQFGEPAGSIVPVAVSNLNPGGLLAPRQVTPISQEFPGRLPPGPLGFDAVLRFPNRTYDLDDLSIIDDPFDISVGALDLKTGKLVGELLHRAFINQDLLFALLRVEPRTPKESFFFRGPARLERGGGKQSVFRFQSNVIVPYPAGFKFPQPNLAMGYVVLSNGTLDPFLWVHAIEGSANAAKSGGAKNIVSDTGERFSYSYSMAGDPGRQRTSFEYVNHSQQGSFKLGNLVWLDFSNSSGRVPSKAGYDTVTFTGYGTWRKDGTQSVQIATVQVSTSRQRPYVGIQIGPGGDVSNVNTKPAKQEDVLP